MTRSLLFTFCVGVPPIANCDASTWHRKGLLQSGEVRTGAVVRALFKASQWTEKLKFYEISWCWP